MDAISRLVFMELGFSHQFLPPKSDWQGIVKGQTPAPLTPKGKEN